MLVVALLYGALCVLTWMFGVKEYYDNEVMENTAAYLETNTLKSDTRPFIEFKFDKNDLESNLTRLKSVYLGANVAKVRSIFEFLVSIYPNPMNKLHLHQVDRIVIQDGPFQLVNVDMDLGDRSYGRYLFIDLSIYRYSRRIAAFSFAVLCSPLAIFILTR